jgi:flagellar P-ring protein FlgI
MKTSTISLFLALGVAFSFATTPVQAESSARLKDIINVQGARANQVTGVGIVVGLQNSGDSLQNRVTNRALENAIQRLNNMPFPELRDSVQSRNTALVMVTCNLPAFLRPGQAVDVTVSSIGDARAITNGVLLMTPLKAADGKTYVVAQGSISTGGYVSTASGSSLQKNQVNVGRIPNGGLVEKEVPVTLVDETGHVNIQLNNPDFATAARVAQSINSARICRAEALDAGLIRLTVPPNYRERISEMISRVEALNVVADTVAKVIIDERTGTVIMGANTRIEPVALTHGSLVIKVDTRVNVSQPNGFGSGNTAVTTESSINAKERPADATVFTGGATLGALVRSLSALKYTPREIISILQDIKAAGALHAQIEII